MLRANLKILTTPAGLTLPPSPGASQPGNMSVGGGGGAGKVNFNDLHVNALIDKSTTAILKHCASGKHLTKVELSVCKAGGQQVEYTRITPKTFS